MPEFRAICRALRFFFVQRFPITFEACDGFLEGEILVSRETADRVALTLPWSGDDELLLYVIHGTLHLVGLDDREDASREIMRSVERKYLIHFQVAQAATHR